MNLITCAEDCEYQKDGYCALDGGAPVSAVRVGGCNYYRPSKPAADRRVNPFGHPAPEVGEKSGDPLH